MIRNVNLLVPAVIYSTMADGQLASLPIDDFPVKDKSLYTPAGFPRSAIGLLDRLSRDNASEEEIKFVASRLQEIKSSPRNDLSDEQILRCIRPSWVQTATEYRDYFVSVQEYLESINKTDDVKDVESVKDTPTEVSPSESEAPK